MRVSGREALLGIVTLVVALFGGTVMLARPQMDEWKSLRMEQKMMKRQIESAKKKVARKDELAKELQELSSGLSRFQMEKDMDEHWRTVLNGRAKANNVILGRLSASKGEIQNGEIFELPIECPTWESDIRGITRFLFDLENGNDMLDIRQLRIKGVKNSDKRSGRFSLYCAYTREGASSDTDNDGKN